MTSVRLRTATFMIARVFSGRNAAILFNILVRGRIIHDLEGNNFAGGKEAKAHAKLIARDILDNRARYRRGVENWQLVITDRTGSRSALSHFRQFGRLGHCADQVRALPRMPPRDPFSVDYLPEPMSGRARARHCRRCPRHVLSLPPHRAERSQWAVRENADVLPQPAGRGRPEICDFQNLPTVPCRTGLRMPLNLAQSARSWAFLHGEGACRRRRCCRPADCRMSHDLTRIECGERRAWAAP